MKTPSTRFNTFGAYLLIAGSILAAPLMAGCGEAPDSASDFRPTGDGALPDSTLISVLADLHLTGAERYLQLRNDSSRTVLEDSTDHLIRRLEADAPVDSLRVDSLLNAHGVTRAGYDSAIDWYVDHPDEFVNLYNRVLDRLNQVR